MRSDNGPNYTSNQFQQFAQEYEFTHVTSSPHYPRSNGFIESQVKLVKGVLKKAKLSKTDPYKALMCLRATPIDNKLPSPAELLLARPIKDNLPRIIKRDASSDEVSERLKEKQALQKLYHDRHVKPLNPLSPGQDVTVRDPVTSKWHPSVIQRKQDSMPRSYIVSTPAGRAVRRNRSDIRSTPPAPTAMTNGPAQSPVDKSPSPPTCSGVDRSPTPGRTPVKTHAPVMNSSPKDMPTTTTRSGRVSVPPKRLDL